MDPFVLTMPPGAMGRPLGVYTTFLAATNGEDTWPSRQSWRQRVGLWLD